MVLPRYIRRVVSQITPSPSSYKNLEVDVLNSLVLMGIDFFLNFKIDSKKFIILNKIGGSFKHLIQ